MRFDLAQGEHIIVRTRAQARSLVFPALFFILLVAAAGFGAGWLARNRNSFDPALSQWIPAMAIAAAAAAAGVVLMLRFCARPLLRWLGTRYVLTSRRLIARSGFTRRREEQYPLVAIVHIGSSQSLLQRSLRSGNISLQVGQSRSSRFVNVPEIARFRNIMLAAIEALPQTAMYDGVGFMDEAGQMEPGLRDGTGCGYRWMDEVNDEREG